MPRKVSSGRVGGPVLGSLSTLSNTFSSVEPNANIVFAPDGTGVVQSDSDIQTNAQTGVRFADSDSSNYVLLRGPATVAVNVTLTLPADDGNANEVLSTDGNGVLSWVPSGLTVTDRTTADSNTYYVTMSDQTSGSEDTLSIATGNRLQFVPSSGTLTATAFSGDGSGLSNVVAISAATVTLTADNATNATSYPLFSASATGNSSPRTDTGYTYNPSTGELTAVILTASSDAAVKKDITTIDNAVEKVMNLRGVSYRRKENDSEEIGVIAQELEKIVPSLVRGEDGNKSVAYGNLVGLLIEAIKDQQNQIQELNRRII